MANASGGPKLHRHQTPGARMEEIYAITEKYDAEYVKSGLSSLEAINQFALIFYKDVAEIYDGLSRVKHVERNPTGFSLLDAPIFGLLVRIWKLLKEVIRYYEEDNAQIISVLERPMIEVAVIATHGRLLRSGASTPPLWHFEAVRGWPSSTSSARSCWSGAPSP